MFSKISFGPSLTDQEERLTPGIEDGIGNLFEEAGIDTGDLRIRACAANQEDLHNKPIKLLSISTRSVSFAAILAIEGHARPYAGMAKEVITDSY